MKTKKVKFYLAVFLLCIPFLIPIFNLSVSAAADVIIMEIGNRRAVVNGTDIMLTVQDNTSNYAVPELRSGKSMLPFAFISETMGADVEWDSASETVTVTLNRRKAEVKVGDFTIIKTSAGGTVSTETLEVAPYIKNGIVYVPLGAITQTLGCYTYYREEYPATGGYRGWPIVSAKILTSTEIDIIVGDGKKRLDDKYNPTTGIKLNKSTATLELNGTKSEKLTATVEPSNATDKTVTWTSDKPGTVSVDQNGNITALAVGTATITAHAADNHKTAECAVTVVNRVTGISLNKNTLNLVIGEAKTEQLTATITPSNATNKKAIWKSNNTAIATVDSNGIVTAIGNGSTEITVTTEDGGKTAQCTVNVTTKVSDIKIKPETLTLKIGKDKDGNITVGSDGKATLTVEISPPEALEKGVTWESSNTEIVTVDSSGNVTVDSSGNVTAVGSGTATITVITVDGAKTATCNVNVEIKVSDIKIKPDAVTLKIEKDKDGNNIDGNDGKATLTAEISPSDASNKNVTWESNNTKIATVDNSGIVTAIGNGSTVITAATEDGGITAQCTVNVTTKVSDITVAPDNLTLKIGKDKDGKISVGADGKTKLTATILPPTATNKNVTWSSNNTKIATVDSSGNVTAVANGTATITVTTVDGEKTATCIVSVEIKVSSVNISSNSKKWDKGKLTLKIGKDEKNITTFGSATLTAEISPDDAFEKGVAWKSNKANVATVDTEGKVTAVGAGTATITVTTADGQKTAKCTVIVEKSLITSIKVGSKTLAPTEKSTKFILTATIKPTTAYNKTLNWKSSIKTIAAVDGTGTITVNRPGITGKGTNKVDITATAKTDDKVSGIGVVTVRRNVVMRLNSPYCFEDEVYAKKNLTDGTIKALLLRSKDGKYAATCIPLTSIERLGTKISWNEKTSTAGFEFNGKVCSIKIGTKAVSVKENGVTKTVSIKVEAQLSGGKTYIPIATISDALKWKIYYDDSCQGIGVFNYSAKADDMKKIVKNASKLNVPVTGITLKHDNKPVTSKTIWNGDSFKLTVSIVPFNATNKTVAWTVGNSKVATVKNGTVTGVAKGITNVWAKVDGIEKSILVEVRQHVTGITLDKSTLEIYTGKTYTLKSTVKPDNAYNKKVTWSSSNTTVATVNQNGVVTGKRAGTATITVKTEDKGFTAKCTVTVKQSVTHIFLSPTSTTVKPGTSIEITADVYPKDASNKLLTWKCADTKVTIGTQSTVSNGKFKALIKIPSDAIPGKKYDIIVSAQDGSGAKGTCTITIGIDIKINHSTYTSIAWKEFQLSATIEPSSANIKTVEWNSNNTWVATVDKNGKVNALRPGKAIITAKAGGKSAQCSLTVKANEMFNNSKTSAVKTDFVNLLGSGTKNIKAIYTTEQAVQIVLNNDSVITETANKLKMPKEMIQAIIMREQWCYGYDELIADAEVVDYYDYKVEYEKWMNYPIWVKLLIPPPVTPYTYRIDCSTGLGQITARTAIDANNYAVGIKIIPGIYYDVTDWHDMNTVWNKLNEKNWYNIEMAGLVLRRSANQKLISSDSFGYSTSQFKHVFTRYNGNYKDISDYGNETYQYFEIFKKYR